MDMADKKPVVEKARFTLRIKPEKVKEIKIHAVEAGFSPANYLVWCFDEVQKRHSDAKN